jgi:two-component system chemotaxis sensor kinase CheA
MKTRMQAIDHLWSKLPRVVRDLSSSVGKQVRLAMEVARPRWTEACWRRSRTR